MLSTIPLTDKLSRARQILRDMRSVLVAFSGGIDSSLVLKLAHDELGTNAVGVTAVSPTFPATELEATRQIAAEIGALHRIVETDQLEIPEFVRNDATRCYHCKTDLYSLLDRLRREQGSTCIVDGTNVDDMGDDRPGLKAAREWGVRSPLLEAEFSKVDIRDAAKELGLSMWEKTGRGLSLVPSSPRDHHHSGHPLAGRTRGSGPSQGRLPPLSRAGPWRDCQDRACNGRTPGFALRRAAPTHGGGPETTGLPFRHCGFGRIPPGRRESSPPGIGG